MKTPNKNSNHFFRTIFFIFGGALYVKRRDASGASRRMTILPDRRPITIIVQRRLKAGSMKSSGATLRRVAPLIYAQNFQRSPVAVGGGVWNLTLFLPDIQDFADIHGMNTHPIIINFCYIRSYTLLDK